MFILKWIRNLFYYGTAFIFALAIALGALFAVGYHFYQETYLAYIDTQKEWVAIDAQAQQYFAFYAKNKTTLNGNAMKNGVSDSHRMRVKSHNNYVEQARKALKKEDKIALYSNVWSSNNVFKEIKTTSAKRMQVGFSRIEEEAKPHITTYNQKANAFNQKHESFPYSLAAKVIGIHELPLLPESE